MFTDTITSTDPVNAINVMTKEECQQKTDLELLNMLQMSAGHTGQDFKDFMHVDFSYTYLTTLLKERGYENGWHKISVESSTPKPTIIKMRKSDDDTVRQSYMIEKSIAEEWKNFNKNVPYKTVTLGYAMQRFMDDVRSGLIKFELEI